MASILMQNFVTIFFFFEQHQFPVCNETQRAVYCIVSCGWGVWISLQSSAVVRLYHATTYENLCDIDVTQTVHKMLAGKWFEYNFFFMEKWRKSRYFCFMVYCHEFMLTSKVVCAFFFIHLNWLSSMNMCQSVGPCTHLGRDGI